jgi:hypothetical protein
MGDAIPAEPAAAPAKVQYVSEAMQISLFGYDINLLSVMIILMIFGILYMFWRIQTSRKLDFTDMITKDGRTVSLTKVLQMIGGLTATWILIKLTLTGNLTEGILAIYLAYVASIEGYSKFISAKYRYNEQSVNRPGAPYESDYIPYGQTHPGPDTGGGPQDGGGQFDDVYYRARGKEPPKNQPTTSDKRRR